MKPNPHYSITSFSVESLSDDGLALLKNEVERETTKRHAAAIINKHVKAIYAAIKAAREDGFYVEVHTYPWESMEECTIEVTQELEEDDD